MSRRMAVTILEKMARRRGQKDGHLFERSGNWLGRYWVDSPDEIDPATGKAKRERVSVTVAPSKGKDGIGKREARQIFREEYLAVVNAANMRPSSAKPLADFVAQRFIPDYLPTLKPTGQAFYKIILSKHVLPILGPVKLRDITVERVQSLLTLKGRSGLSTQTVVHIRNCLSAVLGHAKQMGWFWGELPTKGVRLPAMKRTARQAPSWVQVCELATALPEPCATLVLFLALTGLRIGEAMGLRVKRINLTALPCMMDDEILAPYSLAVRENYVLGRYSTLKTASSIRNVPIPEWFVPRLAALRIAGQLQSSDSPVFANASGNAPTDQHNLAARVMKPVARALGLEWISWHCLRHANSTFADQGGISVVERQKMLGHATSQMAMHYSHADMDRIRERMEKMVDPAALEQAKTAHAAKSSVDFGQQSGPEDGIYGQFIN